MSDTIVCLDGYTLNPGDIDWKPFESLGELTVYDRTPKDAILERAGGAPCLLTNKCPLTADTIAELPDLRYVGVLATGYNVVDLDAANRRGITVTNVPTYGTDSVAQHTIALLLELTRHVALHDAAVKRGEWTRRGDFCFALAPIRELTGMTLGIVGLGNIGTAVARIAAAMGMRLVAYDANFPRRGAELQIEPVDDLDLLFAHADAVTLHCPLTPENRHMVDARRLELMKPTSVLINTSRGPLVDVRALAPALRAGRIAGAALDVLETEPPAAEHPLYELSNCILTPHIAWYAAEARRRLMEIAAANLRAFQAGRPANVVNDPR